MILHTERVGCLQVWFLCDLSFVLHLTCYCTLRGLAAWLELRCTYDQSVPTRYPRKMLRLSQEEPSLEEGRSLAFKL
jgi:hypothetical protein